MSSIYYDDGTDGFGGIVDSGGVHTNSGVNNKAAFLMTDGGTFNGRTVTRARDHEGRGDLLRGRLEHPDLRERLRGPLQRPAPGVPEPGRQRRHHGVRLHRGAGRRARRRDEPPALQQPERLPVGAGGAGLPGRARSRRTPSTTTWRRAARTGASRRPSGTNQWQLDASGDYAHSGRTALYAPNQTGRADVSAFMQTGVTIPGGTTYLRFDQADNWEGFFDFGSFDWHNIDGGVRRVLAERQRDLDRRRSAVHGQRLHRRALDDQRQPARGPQRIHRHDRRLLLDARGVVFARRQQRPLPLPRRYRHG